MQLTQKSSSIIALCLGVPFTSVGAIMTLWIAPGALGQTILVCCQIWLLCLTVIWLLKIEPKPLDFSLPTQNDWITGIAIGLLMFGAIFVVYWLLLEPMLDVNSIRDKLTRIIDIDRQAFIFGGAYFILVNALIEEYFWRWFIYSRCEELTSGKVAVGLTALFFTVHHSIGLAAFVDWRTTLIGSLAVFVAGIIWSEYYRRYRSLWSNYFSHAIADLALHLVAWQIFFG